MDKAFPPFALLFVGIRKINIADLCGRATFRRARPQTNFSWAQFNFDPGSRPWNIALSGLNLWCRQ